MNSRFMSTIFSAGGKQKKSLTEVMYSRNLVLLPIAAITVVLVSLYWIIIDRVSASYNLVFSSRISVYLQMASSAFMVFLPRINKDKKTDRPFIRIAFILYFIIIIFGVGVLTYTRNRDIITSGSISPFIGVSVSAFYLFIIAFFPLYGKLDSFIVIASMYVGLVLPELMARTSTYSLMSHIVLCLCFTSVYYFFRKINVESINHELEANKLSSKLLDESVCDSLTGILNRRALDEYIEHLLRNSHENRIGVAFFDIDFFKKYNDYYGHVEGDEVLRKIAASATEAMKQFLNAYVFRYGGEEFAVVIEGASEAVLIDAMCKLRKAIYDANIRREDIQAFDRITITVGGAIESLPNKTGDYVIAADNQLYIGKNNSRNCVYFKSRNCETGEEGVIPEAGIVNQDLATVPEPTDTRQELADEAKRYQVSFDNALKNGEFVVLCQPKYNAHTREIIGAEALAHWKTPGGYILPSEFIPILEGNGLIRRLDEYIFRYVCREQKKSLDMKLKTLPIAVNMSRITLLEEGTIDSFRNIIGEYGIPKSLVPIELTESSAIGADMLRSKAEEIREAGFTLYLDDFGSGYSSLSALGMIPFDAIKIGKELVSCIGDTVGDEILRHTIELSHFLRKEAIAEGVETNEQLLFLDKLGCESAQGFFLSRPLGFEEYLQLLGRMSASPSENRTMELADEVSLVSLKITGDVKLQYLSALAGIYMSMHVIDLRDNSVAEFTTTTNIRQHVTKASGADKQMEAAMRATVSPEYIDRVLEFCNINTLAERMRGKRSIQMDFVGIHFGWTRAQFVVVSSNEAEEPQVVIYTTQVVEANKLKNEKVEACITDELTGVYNQLAFDSDLPGFADSLKRRRRSQFTVLCANVPNLREVKLQQGNVAKDEVLWGLADCLSKTFGKLGKIYRLNNDHFMVLFAASVEEVHDKCTLLDELTKNWIGNNVRSLTVSYGIASMNEFDDISPQDLVKEAVRRS